MVRKMEDPSKEMMQSSFNSYIAGIQRAFDKYWGYDVSLKSGEVFGNKDTVLKTVLENK